MIIIVDVIYDFYLLSELVHDYIGIVGSVKDAFNERVNEGMAVMAKCSGMELFALVGKLLIIIEGFEQEEGEQGEGRVGQQAGQSQPIEAGDS